MSSVFDIAIIGGGAAGTLAAIHLLKQATTPRRIAIIEPRTALGKGIAYSAQCPQHLLNVVAGRMSAFEDDPDHFLRFLRQDPVLKLGSDLIESAYFASRTTYGRYLAQTLDQCMANSACEIVVFRDEARNVLPEAGIFKINLTSSMQLTATNTVLATGNVLRDISLSDPITGTTHSIPTPWHKDRLSQIAPQDTVLILGGGLSMVDAVVELASHGYEGVIHVLSRHGLHPLPHAVPGKIDGVDLSALLKMQTLRQRTRLLRSYARLAQASGKPWQWLMDTLRPHGEALWISLNAFEQRRFLRHISRFWDVHRHRIAPQVASQLTLLEAKGKLRYHAGHVKIVQATDDGWQVEIEPRASGKVERINVNHVLNCTGLQTNIEYMSNPLIQNLLSQGMIRPGPHRLGLDCDSLGRIRDGKEFTNERFFALGTLRLGQGWESVAVPELRRQAHSVATQILGIHSCSCDSSCR